MDPSGHEWAKLPVTPPVSWWDLRENLPEGLIRQGTACLEMLLNILCSPRARKSRVGLSSAGPAAVADGCLCAAAEAPVSAGVLML